MRNKIKFLHFLLIISLLFAGCENDISNRIDNSTFSDDAQSEERTDSTFSDDTQSEERTERIFREWYDEVLLGFNKNSIQETASAVKAEAEYRIVYNVALQRYDYYSLQVFSNGTGKFTFIVHKSEDFETGKIVLDVSKDISAEETKNLLQVINDNDFYNIPTIHPDGFGLDGTTVFVEGYNNSDIHFITMWEPDEKYQIAKIHKAFADFADTISERPVIRFDED